MCVQIHLFAYVYVSVCMDKCGYLYMGICVYKHTHIHTYICMYACVCGVMIFVIGNEYGDTSSNPGRGCLDEFHVVLIPVRKV